MSPLSRRTLLTAGGALVGSSFIATVGTTAAVADTADGEERPVRQLRGMWIATVWGIDWPTPGASVEQQKEEYLALLDAAVDMKLNAIVSQVRPSADAFWDSPYEPWSQYITGEQGKDPGYDVLGWQIEEAHKRNLEFHAWMNPYRASIQPDKEKLVEDHPARVNDGWAFSFNNQLYYNPGIPEVQEFIRDAMMHCVENYDVDALHWDDYFYPYPSTTGEELPDRETYEEYSDGSRPIDEWRRENVNGMVRKTRERIQAVKPWVKFGISPFGVWRNRTTDPLGSDTRSFESYDQQFADSRRWVTEEWVDYINPQIYWQITNPAAGHAIVVDWWADVVKDTRVRLYIGHGLYQAETWDDIEEFDRQLDHSLATDEVDGNIFYSAKFVRDDPAGALQYMADRHYQRPALIEEFIGGEDEPRAAVPHAVRTTGPKGGTATLRWNRRPKDDATVYYAIWALDSEVTDADEIEATGTLLATQRAVDGPRQTAEVDTEGRPFLAVTALDRRHRMSDARVVKVG